MSPPPPTTCPNCGFETHHSDPTTTTTTTTTEAASTSTANQRIPELEPQTKHPTTSPPPISPPPLHKLTKNQTANPTPPPPPQQQTTTSLISSFLTSRSGAPPPSPPPDTTHPPATTPALQEERRLRILAETQLEQVTGELEELSASLFQSANEMVAEERRERSRLEERVKVLEGREEGVKVRLGVLGRAVERIGRVRGVLGEV